jgi:1,2-diacylglycerol 3-alpha-glucosyltransferase
MMKILFISDVYFPRINGVSTSIRSFVYQLQALGHHVDLIAPDYGIATEDEAWISRVAARNIYFDPEDKLMKFGEVMALLPTLRQQEYDLVHIHTPFVAHYAGLKLARLLDVPCVETYHTFFEDYLHHYLPIIPKLWAKGLARMISRRQCNQVDAIVAPSQPMLDILREYGVRAVAQVVATGLQQESFALADGAAFRVKYGIAADRPVALFVGRVAFEKNISFLLDMLLILRQQQPDILLVIAGEGPAAASLQAQTSKLGLQQQVKFLGYLDRHTELNACYRAADIFVFASTSETQGLVLLEAMAQAVPVVAIAELGTKSILVEGQGALIAPHDPAGFAARVFSLTQDKAQARALGETGRQYAEKRWSAHKQAELMLQFYEDLLVQKNGE